MVCLDKQSYSKFLESHISSDFILECIQSDEKVHPCIDELCMVLIHILKSKTTYIINLNHPDCNVFIDKESLINDFNKLKGKKWVFDKKKCLHLFPINNLFDINIIFFISDGKVEDYSEFDTTAHNVIKTKFQKYGELNKAIPMVKHLEKFESMYDAVLIRLKSVKIDDSFYSINSTITDNLRILEHNGLKVDVELFNRHFENKTIKDKDGYVYTQYNLYTATGRPSNRFGNVNYSALNKENGCRSSFISRYGDLATDLAKSIVRYGKYDVKINPTRWGGCPSKATVEDLSSDEDRQLATMFLTQQLNKQPDLFIQISIPNEFQPVGKYNVGITAGIETTMASGQFVEGLNRMNMNIVTSNHVKKVFESAQYQKQFEDGRKELLKSEKPMEVCFWGADTTVYKKTDEKVESIESVLSSIPEKFAFLFVGQWTHRSLYNDRKDIGNLIKTFSSFGSE